MPLVARSSRHNQSVVEENLRGQAFNRNGFSHRPNSKIDVALVQFALQRSHITLYDMEAHLRMAATQALDHCGQDPRRQRRRASNPYFSGRGIGEELDAFHRLVKLIEHGPAAIEQDATV